jgi:hypothetical protein
MDRRITYGLLIALVVLIALAALLDSNILEPVTPEPGSITPTLAPLWSVDSASITLIRIENLKNSTHVELQKNQQGIWLVMDLPAVEADQTAVTSTIESLSKVLVFHDYGETLNPEEFDLAKPDYLLTVQTSDGNKFILEIGALNPTQTGYYVRIKDTKRIISVRSTVLSAVIGYLDNKPLPATATPTFTITPTVTTTPTETATPTVTATIETLVATPGTPGIENVTETPGTPVPAVTPTPTS